MIYLKNIRIETIDDVRKALQTAIELEHSTIPPYLTAMFTLFETGNDEISKLIGSVVVEEMLHLSIACNLMNAIGGKPVLNQPGFIPTYPGPLPGGVDSGLVVPIAKFTKDLMKDVFMAIEEPEDPIKIKSFMMMKGAEDKLTIGMFYDKIAKQLTFLETEAKQKGKTIFTGDSTYQMTNEKWFPAKELFPITDLLTALRGINIIVDQGEGTSTDPFISEKDLGPDEAAEPAHYYRFEEIYKGRKLVKDPNADSGYSYSGDPIPCDESKIPNMAINPKMSDYPTDSSAYVNSKFFNYTYTNLLNSLHITFNGAPEKIDMAMGLMYSLRLYALRLLKLPSPNQPGYTAGPSYEYITNDNLTPNEKDMYMANKVNV